MRAAVYCRISRRTRTSDETIAEQRKRGLAVIAARGWTLVRDDDEDTFTDDGSSAYRDDVRREAFERLVARCQAREVDLIVCRDVDRLSRRDRDWGRLDVAGHELHVTEWDGIPMDRLIAGIKAQVAADESRKISKRVKLSEGRRVAAGLPPRGGRRCFGFNRDHSVNEAEAEVIRDVVRRYLPPAPEPLTSICRDLDAAGVTTPTGRPWQPRNLRATLRSPRLAGYRVRDGEIFEGAWDAILDRDTHTAILKMRGGTTMREATTWMLNGLAFCGRCGNRLVGNNSGDRRRYHCAPYIGKTHRETGERVDCRLAVDARAAEREVWDRAIARAWQVDDDDQERSEQIVVDARAALVAAERRMDKIDEQYVAGHLTDDRWIKLGHQIQSEVAAARVALDQAEHQRLAHPAWWRLLALSELDDLEVTDARRRAEIHAVVRRVMIKPARRSGPFDAARVEVDWR